MKSAVPQFVVIVAEGVGVVGRIVASRLGGPATRGVLVEVTNETGSILVVKARYRRAWSLPGGWVDPDESFVDAARREVAEETGFELDGEPELVGELVRRCHLDRFYAGRVGGLTNRPTTPWEISGVQWISPDTIGMLSKASVQALALRAERSAASSSGPQQWEGEAR